MMLPISTYLSIAKDAFIIAAVGFVLWFVYHHGGDNVKIADMRALTAQIEANNKQLEGWAQQQAAAEETHEQEVSEIKSRIASNASPLWMCRPPDTRAVSNPAPAPKGPDPQSRPVDTGSGVDIRAAINGFELKYEQALADCRQVIASWPH